MRESTLTPIHCLEGGVGLEVFQYNASPGFRGFGSSNDGVDEIRDTDGKGVLRYRFGSSEGAVIGGASAERVARWA